MQVAVTSSQLPYRRKFQVARPHTNHPPVNSFCVSWVLSLRPLACDRAEPRCEVRPSCPSSPTDGSYKYWYRHKFEQSNRSSEQVLSEMSRRVPKSCETCSAQRKHRHAYERPVPIASQHLPFQPAPRPLPSMAVHVPKNLRSRTGHIVLWVSQDPVLCCHRGTKQTVAGKMEKTCRMFVRILVELF